jgi:hypothetical protein
MQFPPPPTPGEFLISLAWFVGTGIAFILISGGANRAADRTAGIRARVSRFMAYATLIIGVAGLFIVGLSMVYPHNHHDVQWLKGSGSANYAVDVAIGLAVWVIAWGAYRLSWRKPAG